MSKKKIISFIIIIFLSMQVLFAQYDFNLLTPDDGDIFLPGDEVYVSCSPKNMWYATGGVFELYMDNIRKEYIRWWDDMDFNYYVKIEENDPRDYHTIRVEMRWDTTTGEKFDSEEVTIYVDKRAPTVHIIKPVPG